ncbi:MAG TPA: DUF6183 family protein [Actinoplanes sp.]|nr:DUF6183 family protein [Actinoplanes sp.]
MTKDPAAIAATLTTLDDLAQVSRWLDGGDVRFAVDLGLELWRRHGDDQVPPWQFGSLFDGILRRLALRPGPVTETAAFFSTVARGRRARYVASLLATEHSASELRALAGNAELSACLSQELPLRAYVPGRMWARPPHPLAWLSLRLTSMEQWPNMPRHDLRGTGTVHSRVVATPIPAGGPLPSWREEADTGDIAAAVSNWCTASNGRAATRVVVFDQPVTPAALPGIEGLTGTEGFGVCSLADAWHQLFEAASLGGAYSRGEFGAYGRLAAWRSVAALTGAPRDATFREVVALAEAGTWIWFGGATDWFAGDGWDLGVAVLSADGRRLAVLAATDTD